MALVVLPLVQLLVVASANTTAREFAIAHGASSLRQTPRLRREPPQFIPDDNDQAADLPSGEAAVPPPLNNGPCTQEGSKSSTIDGVEPCQYKGKGEPTAPAAEALQPGQLDVPLPKGDQSTQIGASTEASGESSTALGTKTLARGRFSTALGWSTQALGQHSTALGRNTIANGKSSTAIGDTTEASGDNSLAMGFGTKATGDYSTAMGQSTRAVWGWATSMGFQTSASGEASTAMGHNTCVLPCCPRRSATLRLRLTETFICCLAGRPRVSTRSPLEDTPRP